MTEREPEKELAERLERSIIATGGEAVDATNSQGLVYMPSGPVVQFYANELKVYVEGGAAAMESMQPHLSMQSDMHSSLLQPYLRTIKTQEQVISQYKTVTENRIKSALDDVVDLINIHQFNRAVTLLGKIRDKEMLESLPSMDAVDPHLQESVHRLLGICYLRLNALDTAYKHMEIAKSIMPESEQIDRALLEYYLTIDNQTAAAEIAQKLLKQDGDCVAAHNAFAIIRLRKGEFEEVVDFYQDISTADEDSVAQSVLCYAHMQLGNVLLALEHALKFTKLEPELPSAQETLGNVYHAMAYRVVSKQTTIYSDGYSEAVDRVSLNMAIQAYQKAHKLYQERDQEYSSEGLWINLTIALAGVGRLQDALRMVNKSLTNLPSPNIYHYELKARIQQGLGDLDSALATCQDAAETFPDDARMKVNVAGLCLNQRLPNEARFWLDQAEVMCRDPRTLMFIQIVRTKTFLLESNSELALDALQQIPEDYKDSVDTALVTGDYFTHFKRYAEAEACFQRALSREPQNLALLHRVTAFYRLVERPQEALVYAERIADLTSTSEARAGCAELLLQANRPEDALTVLTDIGIGSGETAYRKLLRAMCLQQLRRFSEAIPLYVDVLGSAPDNFVAQYNLALCHVHLSQRSEAITALLKAENLRPDAVPVHAILAQLYHVEADTNRAYRHARRALDLATDDPDMYLFFFGIAHSCGYEEEASKTLMEIPRRFPEYQNLRMVPEDQAREIIVSSRRQYDQARKFYQSGNLPLFLLSRWLGKPLPLVWQLFTHDATANLLTATGSYEEQRSSFRAANQAAEIVVDYMTLITLYNLNLMTLPALLFDRVYVSQGTLDQIQEDIQRLTLLVSSSQINRNESLITFILEHPKCHVQSDWLDDQLLLDAQQRDLVEPHTTQDLLLTKTLDAFYVVDDSRLFVTVGQMLPDRALTIRDLVEFLWRFGKIRKDAYDDAIDYLGKTHHVEIYGFGDLDFSAGLVLSYGALVTLACGALLNSVVDSFGAIHLSILTVVLLHQGVNEVKFYQETLDTIKRIEVGIAESQVFIVRPATRPVGVALTTDTESVLDAVFMETQILAEELQLPLWTDDLASRKLLASRSPEAAAFDTRIALDVAFNRQCIGQDVFGGAVLQLLRWNYQFAHVSSDLIYWTIEQHNFCDNEDTDVLLDALDASIESAYRTVVTEMLTEVGDSPVLEHQFALFASNINVYAQLLLRVWKNTPSEDKYTRSKWASIIFGRINDTAPDHFIGLNHLMLICLLELLRDSDDERLDHFLVFCSSGFTLPRREDADSRILLVLVSLYNQGNFSDQDLCTAARLLKTLRLAQHARVMQSFVRQVPASFVEAVGAKRKLLENPL